MRRNHTLEKNFIGFGLLFGVGVMLAVMGVVTIWRGLNSSKTLAVRSTEARGTVQETHPDESQQDDISVQGGENQSNEIYVGGNSGFDDEAYVIPITFSVSGIRNFSFNASGVLAVSADRKIWLYEPQNLGLIRTFDLDADAFSWSPDGTKFLVQTSDIHLDDFLELWDAKTGTMIWRKNLPVSDFGCNQTNSHITPFFSWMGEGETILLILSLERMETWDAATGNKVSETEFPIEYIRDFVRIDTWGGCKYGLAWAPDHVHFALFPSQLEFDWNTPDFMVWDGIHHQLINRWKGENAYGYDRAFFSPDSRYLAAGTNHIELWDWQNKIISATSPNFSHSPEFIWAPSGNSIAVLDNNRTDVYVYALPDFQELSHLSNLGETDNIAWTPNGQLVTETNDTLRFYNPDSGQLEPRITNFSYTGIIGWSPTEHKLALLSEGGFNIIDLDSGDLQVHDMGWNRYIDKATWLPDGNLGFFTYEDEVLYVTPSGDIVNRWANYGEDTPRHIWWSPNGSSAAVLFNDLKTIIVFDMSLENELARYTLPGQVAILNNDAFSFDGEYIAFFDENGLSVIKLSNGNIIEFPTEIAGDLVSPFVQWSPINNQLVGFTEENTLWLWSMDNYHDVQIWPISDITESDVPLFLIPTWSPDGKYVMITGAQNSYLWGSSIEQVVGTYNFMCYTFDYSFDGSMGVCTDMSYEDITVVAFSSQASDFPWIKPIDDTGLFAP